MSNSNDIIPQSITSEDTSVNQVPGLMRVADLAKGSRNLDYGGGKYDRGTEYLRDERGVENHVYDPFNRNDKHNQAVVARFKQSPADSATFANVLNVIPEKEHRLLAIRRAADLVKPGGKLFFSVYEKDKTGVGEQTRAGWQANRPLEHYLDEIRSVLPDAVRKGKMIVGTKPSVDDASIRNALLAAARATKRAGGGRVKPFADLLYSGGAQAARELKQERGTPDQMLASLKGVKKDELEHARVGDLIKDKPQVSKNEIADIFERNAPSVDEKKRKDGHEQYTIPGGSNYRTILLKLPEHEGLQKSDARHWPNDRNTAAHIRLKDRVGPNGEKVLHVEEVQSDWGQTGRDRGFAFGKNRLTLRPGEVEPAPYVTNTDSWTDLALKRVMYEAAKGGYDKVAWTPGKQQADRYQLSKHIDQLAYFPYQDADGSTKYKLRAGKDGRMLVEKSGLDENGLAAHVGKDLAKKIVEGHNTEQRDINTIIGGDNRPIGQRREMRPWNVISGLDLNVGGGGMLKYYDNIVPKSFARILKDHGGVEFDSIEGMTPRRAYNDATAPLLRAYEEARAQHQRAYNDAIAPHERAYGEARAQHQRAYGEARAQHQRAYEEAVAQHERAYNDARAQHRRAYDDAIAPHQRAYDEAVAPHRRAYDDAIAPHQRAYDEAQSRGEDIDDPGYPELPSFDVTPEMRESILTKGFKSFARGGEVGKAPMNDDSIKRALLIAARATRRNPAGALSTNMAQGGSAFKIQPSKTSLTIPTGQQKYEFAKTTPGQVKTIDLVNAFNQGIDRHLSLSPGDQILNYREAVKALEPYLGTRKDGSPIALISQNAKLLKAKGGNDEEKIVLPDGRGVDTTGLALFPDLREGSFRMCPNSASCSKLCLGKTAGQYSDAFTASQEKVGQTSVRQRALNRSIAFLREPEAFAVRLFGDIERAKRQADLDGNHLGMRLNVLSDLHPRIFKKIIENHPDVSFYDYTKMAYKPVASNHHYTHSSTGLSQEDVDNPHTNWNKMRKLLDEGQNVAMVFTNSEKKIPDFVHDTVTDKKYSVVDGRTHDFRPLDMQPQGADGVIVGLSNLKSTGSKNEAHKDSKGFFVRYDPSSGRGLSISPQKKQTLDLDNNGSVNADHLVNVDKYLE